MSNFVVSIVRKFGPLVYTSFCQNDFFGNHVIDEYRGLLQKNPIKMRKYLDVTWMYIYVSYQA